MKKAILILLFFIAQSNLFSQASYCAFPDSNATWIERHEWGGSYPCLQVHDYEIYIEKDTIMSGFIYKKLNFNRDNFVIAYPGCSWAVTHSYDGGIFGYYRNDTVNKVIYLKNYFNGTLASDSVLYDFSKLPGDTVYSIMGKYVVDSITTVQIGNTFRKGFYVIYPPSAGSSSITQIIEGVGSLQGLVPWPGDWEGSDMLECFSQNSRKIYPDTTGACHHITSVIAFDKNEIKMFPNPASDKIYIEGSDLNKNAIIKISNVLGETVRETQLTSSTIDINGINPGIYFIDIFRDNKTIERSKFLIGN